MKKKIPRAIRLIWCFEDLQSKKRIYAKMCQKMPKKLEREVLKFEAILEELKAKHPQKYQCFYLT